MRKVGRELVTVEVGWCGSRGFIRLVCLLLHMFEIKKLFYGSSLIVLNRQPMLKTAFYILTYF